MRLLVAALVAMPCVMGNMNFERAEGSLEPAQRAASENERVATFAERASFDSFGQARAEPSDLEISPESGLPERDFDLPVAQPASSVVTLTQFCDALADAAQANDLPVSFFARLIWQESEFRFDEISNAGAQGVAQFMPETALEVGLDDPFDPLKALPASARLLRKLRDQLGNIGLAAAAYNAGTGRIQNWLARRGALPAETRNYVRRITGNAAEDWTAENRRIKVPSELPSDAPCDGVGGLSRIREPMAIPVALAPEIRGILEKVRLAEVAARKKAAELRRRLARHGKGRSKHAVVARAGRQPAHGDGTRVASAERRPD